MSRKKENRNKMVVILKEVGELTNDPDLSYRKIAEEFGTNHPTIQGIVRRDREKYTIKGKLKPIEPKK